MENTEYLAVDASDESGTYYALIPITDHFKTNMAARITCFWDARKGTAPNLDSMSEEYSGAIFILFSKDIFKLFDALNSRSEDSHGKFVFVPKGTITDDSVTTIEGRITMSWGACGFCWGLASNAGDRYLTSYVELGQILRAIPFRTRVTSLVMPAERYLGEQCGQCDCYHPAGYTGDCRDDLNRFGAPEELADLWAAAPKMRALLEQFSGVNMDDESKSDDELLNTLADLRNEARPLINITK